MDFERAMAIFGMVSIFIMCALASGIIFYQFEEWLDKRDEQ